MTGAVGIAGVCVITFDAAGTLLRPHPSVGAVYREVALQHGRDYAEEDLNREFRRAFHCVSKDGQVLDPEGRERDFWRRVVLEALRPLGGPPGDFGAFFAELWETFAHGARWRVFPDAVATLAVLRTRGYRLGVLSNWDGRLHTVLAETGLRPFFDAVVISSEAGAEKPDPGIFRAAEIALRARAGECLHVGDSRQHDYAGARQAGWEVLILRNSDGSTADGEIGCLGDLLECLPARQAKPAPARTEGARKKPSAVEGHARTALNERTESRKW